MVHPEPSLLAPAASPAAKCVRAFLIGLLTHPANWIEHLATASPVGAVTLFKGHELEASSSPTWTRSTTTGTATSTGSPSTITTTSSVSPCSVPEPLRFVGEGHRATIEIPVVVTFSVALGTETVALAFCCWALQRRGAERRSRQPLGASRIQVQ